MRSWRIMLGPFVIWAVHFIGVYVLASLESVSDPSQAGRWRMLGLALGGACLLALGLGALRIVRPGEASELVRSLGLGGGTLAGVAIVWQSLPLLVSAFAVSQS